jgi:uncharacterized protein (DUF885 family)
MSIQMFTSLSSAQRTPLVRLLTSLLALLLIGPSAQAQGRSMASPGGAQWDAHVTSLIEAYFAAWPSAGVSAGRHEYDGRLPDFSPAGLAAFDTLFTNWRSRTAAFDTTALDADRRFEREYVLAMLDRQLWSLKSVDAPHRSPSFYAGALDPNVYLTRPYAPLRRRMQAYIRYARAVARAAPQIQGNLRPPLARTMIDRGRGAFGGFASFYKENVPAVFAAVNDSALQRELAQVNDSAAAAMRSLDTWLEAQRGTQTEDFAIGVDRFREMLYASERVDTSLEELERIGRADLARNQAALREACARYAAGASLTDCVRKADAHKPPENTLDAARRQLKMLRQFVAEHGVVSIPGTEEALVGESPPYMRYNTAYIQIPGPYDLTLPSTYYVAPPDPSWTAEQRAGYIPSEANLLFISVHEVWPGHFLQFLHAKRVRSLFGRLFGTAAFSEGWAHYTEEMMWDEGLGAGDPETHIGQITNALLRDVRFLSAMGLHTRGMTVAESERMFREEAFQGEAVSRQQAARGTFDPGYLSYTMGKLMIRKLRDDWCASRGGKAAWKQFHDQFLSYGSPPIPLVRRAMMGGDATGSGALF